MPALFTPDIAAYLNRIGIAAERPLAPDLALLRDLQLAHLLAVPFENLSIARHEPIILDETLLYDKIVARRRGGFCYELNGLFAALLHALGYRVTLLSARVEGEDGYTPEFDHLVLRVDLAEPWLVDVGFGAGPRAPLRLNAPEPLSGVDGTYRVIADSVDHILQRREDDDAHWRVEYRFTLTPRRLEEFAEMCRYHQSSPRSHFTRKRICSLARLAGRITLSDNRLIVTQDGARSESVLDTPDAADAILRDYFGIQVPLDGAVS